MPINVKGESHTYIHEMDYGRRQRLHEILDTSDTWRELSQRLIPPYPREKVEKFARAVFVPGGSPSDALLTDWGRGNRTIVELFKILAHMKHYQAMECLKQDIPIRYHKYIPRSYPRANTPESMSCSNISTVNLPIPGSNTLEINRSHPQSPLESSSAAGPPSYRSRSNIQAPNRENRDISSRIVPPKRYDQVRDRIVINNLDSNQRHKEPSEEEKYPKKNIHNNYDVDLPSELLSQGGLAKQLNHQHNAVRQNLYPSSNIPQILVSSQAEAAQVQQLQGINQQKVIKQLPLAVNKSRHISHPSNTYMRSESQGTNGTIAESTFKKRILEEGKVSSPNPDIMLKNVDLRELAEACNDFHISNQIGKGGFGVVYRGRWNGQDIAVKRIKDERRRPGDIKVFKRYVNQAINELISLHNFPAENILQLLAYSYHENFAEAYNESLNTDHFPVDLVYMYMVNGSVSDRLRRRGGTEPLSWEHRSNIALGTARGLLHLHSHNIIHGDIKSGNILLDKHFEPKIGDFGLARGGPESDSLSYILASSLQGTMSYLPDDYCRSRQLTEQVDTFCYGMLLFELVSGKSPSWQDPECARPDLPDYCKCKKRSTMRELMLGASSLKDHSKLVDQTAGILKSDSIPKTSNATHPWGECLFRFGKDCTKSKRKDRPTMKQMFNALEKVHQNPSCLHWIPSLEIGDDTELIVSSVILSNEGAQNISPLRTIKERNIAKDNSESPSELPLPPSEDPIAIQKPVCNPSTSNRANQAPPPYIPAMIPLPILEQNSNSMCDDTGTNKNIDVVSEDQTEESYSAARFRMGIDEDSDEGNEASRSYAYTKDGSGVDIEISKHVFAEEDIIPYCTSGAAALPPRFYTNRPEYDMPNLENLSVRGDVKEPVENRSENFDDGIPKLPDLGWVDVDPMNRLYKAESAVSDASKQDLMSDL